MATPLEQLDAMRGLAPNWDGYNADPPAGHVLDVNDTKSVRRFVEYVEKAQGFFDRHGSKTIVLARFVPVVMKRCSTTRSALGM